VAAGGEGAATASESGLFPRGPDSTADHFTRASAQRYEAARGPGENRNEPRDAYMHTCVSARCEAAAPFNTVRLVVRAAADQLTNVLIDYAFHLN
jgi:hypothetical protein